MSKKRELFGMAFGKAIVAVLCTTSLTAPAMAESTLVQDAKPVEIGLIIEDVGASERINFSGKLRMLSQRIPAAACNMAAGIEIDTSREILNGAVAEFAKIVDALEFGDDSIGIKGAESRRKTLMQIEKLRAEWTPFRQAAENIAAGQDADAALVYVSENNLKVLEEAKLLVSEVSTEYSNPAEMTQANAMLIDISGRQRMLTQKMAKEVCGVETGNQAMGDAEALGKTMGLFEASLVALKDGFEGAGINPPPTDAIQAGLDDIFNDWQGISADMKLVTAKDAVGLDAMSSIYGRLNVALKEMNDVVGLYSEAAKSSI
jgi:hypothetical protein